MCSKSRVAAHWATVGFAFGLNSRANKIGGTGFSEDDLSFGTGLLDIFSCTMEGATGSVSSHPVVKLCSLQIVTDFGSSSFIVKFPICFGLKLMAEEPTMLLRELRRLLNHAGALSGLGRDDHLRSEHAHELATFDAERLGHGDYAWISALSAHHGDGNTSVAGRRLDDCLPWLERTILLGGLDNGQRQTILHGGERIEVLALCVNCPAGRTNPIRDLDQGRIPDGLADVIEGRSVSFSSRLDI
mmetsp:Transcript_25923/g.62253  ORF Transcript_25923/g.62253 Transcript_25923/m.62253 type:complete len:244 (+) Transcript_25923:466-1197(+)